MPLCQLENTGSSTLKSFLNKVGWILVAVTAVSYIRIHTQFKWVLESHQCMCMYVVVVSTPEYPALL